MSESAARAAIKTGRWEVEDADTFAGDTTCPRRDVTRVVVRSFHHLGHRGVLDLVFINERLAETLYAPEDPPGYVHALRTAGIALTMPERGETDPPQVVSHSLRTDVWAYYGAFIIDDVPVEKMYVTWEDRAISAEDDRWDERCNPL